MLGHSLYHPGGKRDGLLEQLLARDRRMRDGDAIELLADPGQDAGEKETEHILHKGRDIREIACADAQSWW